ncbi:expressed protein [Phakopsora pachyrhizi]|uniref:Expressed protein n=1 Tax=Phakopsora pachyrhizi TaxID=170000 RepID=A0AAV0AW03_PHAPC|nr:expressed protein [Phakopsora pachyrhizi]
MRNFINNLSKMRSYHHRAKLIQFHRAQNQAKGLVRSFSTTVPIRWPDRRSESSEQSSDATNDQVADSCAAFDGTKSDPHSSARDLSAEKGIDMDESAANEKSSQAPASTVVKKKGVQIRR